jgi:hypothetical protein
MVKSKLEIDSVWQIAPDPSVTVKPAPESELASKKTGSPVTGALAPPAPPEVAAQLVVVELSHVPDPPTQYLLAMSCL